MMTAWLVEQFGELLFVINLIELDEFFFHFPGFFKEIFKGIEKSLMFFTKSYLVMKQNWPPFRRLSELDDF